MLFTHFIIIGCCVFEHVLRKLSENYNSLSYHVKYFFVIMLRVLTKTCCLFLNKMLIFLSKEYFKGKNKN